MENEQKKIAYVECSITRNEYEQLVFNYQMNGNPKLIMTLIGEAIIELAEKSESEPEKVAADCVTLGTLKRIVRMV